MLSSRLAFVLVVLAGSPALANDPNTDDAAQVGQLTPAPDAPRDVALPAHEQAAQRCWGRAVRSKGAPRTHVVASYRVTARGRVRAARVLSSPGQPPAARRCVLGALRAHPFSADEVVRALGDRPEEREILHEFVLDRVDPPIRNRAIARLLGTLSVADARGIADVLSAGELRGGHGARLIQGIGALGTGTGGGVGSGGQASGLGTLQGAVQIGEPSVRGGLASAVVRRVLAASLGRFRACAALAHGTSPTLAGRLDAHVVISAQGAITEAALSPEGPADATLRRCMTTTLRSLRFPTPEGGGLVIADFTLTLSP